MKTLSLIAAILLGISCNVQEEDVVLKLWYDQPSSSWNEALPVGNGRLGAMVFGGVSQEHIQFNEETLWTGGPHDYVHEGAVEYLEPLRQLLSEGKQDKAHELAMEEFMSTPLTQKEYQPFGDLYLDFPGHESYTEYHRELDISSALCRTSYSVNDVHYTREVIVSHPSQIIAIRLEADSPGSLSFDLWLDSEHEEHSLETFSGKQILNVAVKDGALRGTAGIRGENGWKDQQQWR